MTPRPLRTFTVVPAVPPALSRLRELALNVRWSWDRETIDVFRRLDQDLWEATRNPILMLGTVRQERLDEAAADDGFVAQYRRVCERLDAYMGRASGNGAGAAATAPWFPRTYRSSDVSIAYFSAEFGITECLAIYSGGLGVLSGDHLKSASDLGVPLVGIGLAYQEGYFRQYLNADGWQGELYPDNDFYNLPMTLEKGADGSPLKIEIDLPSRNIVAQIWRVQVGRVPLFLLDANVPETAPEDRVASLRLYSTGEPRIKQEILLGIGGVRALDALGYTPTVFHMNEGHSAFLGLERMRRRMEADGLSFQAAREAVAAGGVFTTHTIVPAAMDAFPPDMIDRYFGHWYGRLGISRDELMALGRWTPGDTNEPLSMAVLAVRLSGQTNGVSKLHSEVSRKAWATLWPGVPANEAPIDSVTNGVHALSWVSADMLGLYERYLGPRWTEAGMSRDQADAAVWARANEIPGEELWRTHERRRERLVHFARRRLRAQLAARGASATELEQASEVLDPGALTIGFARRFTTYKRAALLLQDADRLAAIANNRERPMQFIFAGKSHPADNGGKELIREIVRASRREELRRRIVFIEDYDVNVARYMVGGCDVWLNLPRRPLEASGTSGMKAALNGGLHMSVLDGWWAEAYRPGLGWAVGSGEEYQDEGYQDYVEARAVYDLLEKEVVPLFYDRGLDDLPRGWIQMMRAAIRELGPVYNTNRMLYEYTQRFYLPAAMRSTHLAAEGAAGAKALAAWKARVRDAWGNVRIDSVEGPDENPSTSSVPGPQTVPVPQTGGGTGHPGGPGNPGPAIAVGSALPVTARVRLGPLAPDDVSVQLYGGSVDAQGNIAGGEVLEMAVDAADGAGGNASQDGVLTYTGAIPCRSSGLHGYSVRVVPRHPDLANPYEPGLVTWAS